MKTLNITLIGILFTLNNFAQVSYDTIHSKEWDSKSETWIFFDRMIAAYENGKLVSELVQIYEGEEWLNYNSKSLFYMNGLLIEEIERFWNDNNGTWIDNYRKLYSYSADEKLIQILHQNIFNGNYVNASRETLKYNEEGNLIEKVVENYEEAWTNFLKYQYYFNKDGLLLEENLTYWSNDSWGTDGFSIIKTYDSKGNVAAKVKTKRSGSHSINLVREEFIYNAEGRLDEQIISQWSPSKKLWVNKNRAVYVNNLHGYVCSLMNQNREKKNWTNYLFTEFTGNNELLTGLELAEGMAFSIYPINFGKQAMIEFNNPYNEDYFVRVLNENGQLMASAMTNNGEVTIDARNFIKGIYFVELQGSNLFSGKFSIK